jgi:hypothetical protein
VEPSAGTTPTSPADTPVTWMMLAAVRRETSSAATSLSTAASSVTKSLTTAQTASPTTVTGLFQSIVYAPLHTLIEDWINSGPGGPAPRLVKAGMVTREPDPDGRRGTMISCTEGGQRLFDVLAPDHLLPRKTNLAGTHIRRLVRNRHSCAQFVS